MQVYCIFSTCTTSWQRKFTFAISSPDEFLGFTYIILFSERELTFKFAIRHQSSVCLSSVTFVRPTQMIEIFSNVSTAFGTLAIRDLCIKILRRSSQGNPSVGGVKQKRGSRI